MQPSQMPFHYSSDLKNVLSKHSDPKLAVDEMEHLAISKNILQLLKLYEKQISQSIPEHNNIKDFLNGFSEVLTYLNKVNPYPDRFALVDAHLNILFTHTIHFYQFNYQEKSDHENQQANELINEVDLFFKESLEKVKKELTSEEHTLFILRTMRFLLQCKALSPTKTIDALLLNKAECIPQEDSLLSGVLTWLLKTDKPCNGPIPLLKKAAKHLSKHPNLSPQFTGDQTKLSRNLFYSY